MNFCIVLYRSNVLTKHDFLLITKIDSKKFHATFRTSPYIMYTFQEEHLKEFIVYWLLFMPRRIFNKIASRLMGLNSHVYFSFPPLSFFLPFCSTSKTHICIKKCLDIPRNNELTV